MKHYDVDPDKLAQVFYNTTSTYKFYWMLALLHQIKEGKAYKCISFTEVVASMIAKAWGPVTCNQFTFGKCDALIKRIWHIIINSELKNNDVEDRVEKYIIAHAEDKEIKEIVEKMTKYVPYRFLYPWIGNISNGQTAIQSQNFEANRCPYCIIGKNIRFNPAWVDYLVDHIVFLEAFAKLFLNYFLYQYNHNLIFADNDIAMQTADGQSSTLMSSIGLASESPTPYNQSDEVKALRNELKKKQQEYNKIKGYLDKVLSIFEPMHIINNYGPSTLIDNHDGGNITNSSNV